MLQRARALVFGVMLVAAAPPAVAGAAEPTDDHVELVSLTTRAPTPDVAADVIPFQAVVTYRLHTPPSGFLLLVPYQDAAASSTSQSSAEVPVPSGSGQVRLNLDYSPTPGVRSLTLMVGLFKDEHTLLTWIATKPFELDAWPGHAAFQQGMAARATQDYAAAESFFSAAIGLSPDTASYYYWRGDTRTYLGHYDTAVEDFTRSIALVPDDRASYLGRGIARLWQGDPQAALDDLTFAIDHSSAPDRVTAFAYRVRGTAYAALKQPAQAISDYQAYLALVPAADDRAEVEGWIADLT
jgi:hypothetical protein